MEPEIAVELPISQSRMDPPNLVMSGRECRVPYEGRAVMAIAFAWIDVRDVRPPDSKTYVVLNDIDCLVPGNVLDALNNYDVKAIVWSGRNAATEELAA
jgi:hypothetical protein